MGTAHTGCQHCPTSSCGRCELRRGGRGIGLSVPQAPPPLCCCRSSPLAAPGTDGGAPPGVRAAVPRGWPGRDGLGDGGPAALQAGSLLAQRGPQAPPLGLALRSGGGGWSGVAVPTTCRAEVRGAATLASMEPLNTVVEQIPLPTEVYDVCRTRGRVGGWGLGTQFPPWMLAVTFTVCPDCVQALFDRYAQVSGALVDGEQAVFVVAQGQPLSFSGIISFVACLIGVQNAGPHHAMQVVVFIGE